MSGLGSSSTTAGVVVLVVGARVVRVLGRFSRTRLVCSRARTPRLSLPESREPIKIPTESLVDDSVGPGRWDAPVVECPESRRESPSDRMSLGGAGPSLFVRCGTGDQDPFRDMLEVGRWGRVDVDSWDRAVAVTDGGGVCSVSQVSLGAVTLTGVWARDVVGGLGRCRGVDG